MIEPKQPTPRLWRMSIGVLQFQPGKHKHKQVLPAVEAQVLSQRRDVLEEGVPPREGASKQGTAFVQQLQHRVEQEGQDIQ